MENPKTPHGIDRLLLMANFMPLLGTENHKKELKRFSTWIEKNIIAIGQLAYFKSKLNECVRINLQLLVSSCEGSTMESTIKMSLTDKDDKYIKDGKNKAINDFMDTVNVNYSEWNGLMKVIDRVERLDFRVTINFANCLIEKYDENGNDETIVEVGQASGNDKLDIVFNSIVMFIEYYE